MVHWHKCIRKDFSFQLFSLLEKSNKLDKNNRKLVSYERKEGKCNEAVYK